MKRAYLKWDIKPDGIHVTVDQAVRGQVDADEVIRELRSEGIMNLDEKRLMDILVRCSGRSEYLGPPFQKFDGRKLEYIQMDIRPHAVRVMVQPSFRHSGLTLVSKDIEYILGLKNIVVGVDWVAIQGFLKSIPYGDWVIIASAIEPENGKNARIDEIVQVDRDMRPLMLSNGMVDFKRLENIRQIEENALIAVRIPPTLGKPGKDVFGAPIAPTPGEDVALPAGSYMVVNAAQTELRTSCAGYLYREESGDIAVGRLFIVPGDVNYKIGNVKYAGDVLIQGNVLTDFEVEADGDITIQGSVDGARIISNRGKVMIRDGVFGKGKALIQAKAGVTVSMAQQADFRVEEGDLVFAKSLTDCKVKAKSLLPSKTMTKIISCDVVVYDIVACSHVGAPNGSKTKIRFLNKELEQLEKLYEEINALHAKNVQQAQQFEERLKTMKAILMKSSEVSERSKEELKKVLIQYQAAQKNVEILTEKRQQIAVQKKMTDRLPGWVQFEKLQSNLVVTISDEDLELKPAMEASAVCWRGGSFKMVAPEPWEKFIMHQNEENFSETLDAKEIES